MPVLLVRWLSFPSRTARNSGVSGSGMGAGSVPSRTVIPEGRVVKSGRVSATMRGMGAPKRRRSLAALVLGMTMSASISTLIMRRCSASQASRLSVKCEKKPVQVVFRDSRDLTIMGQTLTGDRRNHGVVSRGWSQFIVVRGPLGSVDRHTTGTALARPVRRRPLSPA